MKVLPPSPDLEHLKKQARRLLRDARGGASDALERFVAWLPAARGVPLASLAQRPLKLHDAQSVIAREYGFRSWSDLRQAVAFARAESGERLRLWLGWVFEGRARERAVAVRMLDESPGLLAGDPWLACTVGNEERLGQALAADPDFANRPGGPFGMPPLVAVTHSRLIGAPRFEAPLLASAARLLRQGADPDGTWTDPRFPEHPLSALYGASGRTHHAGMTKLLLEAGANPNDNESLYHSLEAADDECTRLLLAAGARVARTNAIGRALDFDRPENLRLLLAHGGDANEHPWLHHAIRRGRSLDHVRVLVEHGADPRAEGPDGASVYRTARLFGRADIVAFLEGLGLSEPLSAEEAFVAAASEGNAERARRIAQEEPGILTRLGETHLRALPRAAAVGDLTGLRTMLALGWPREVKDPEWGATALNLAVFRGDAAMTRLLLAEGADWRTPHGFGSNVVGTLSYASQAEDIDNAAPHDHAGCAEALIAHGVPPSEFARHAYSDEVAAIIEDAFEAPQPARGGLSA